MEGMKPAAPSALKETWEATEPIPSQPSTGHTARALQMPGVSLRAAHLCPPHTHTPGHPSMRKPSPAKTLHPEAPSKPANRFFLSEQICLAFTPRTGPHTGSPPTSVGRHPGTDFSNPQASEVGSMAAVIRHSDRPAGC